MSCCVPPPVFVEAIAGPQRVGPQADEIVLASREVDNGLRQTDMSVPSIHLRGLRAGDRERAR